MIEAGQVKKRKKGVSKRFRDEYGHSPLSAEEDIPWGGKQLIIGTGVYGKLPIMPAVAAEANGFATKMEVARAATVSRTARGAWRRGQSPFRGSGRCLRVQYSALRGSRSSAGD